jgi:hypothetical protein
LSSGNIFLGAFAEHPDQDSGDGDDDIYYGSGSGSAFSSILVDSCDRKYDRLYQ